MSQTIAFAGIDAMGAPIALSRSTGAGDHWRLDFRRGSPDRLCWLDGVRRRGDARNDARRPRNRRERCAGHADR